MNSKFSQKPGQITLNDDLQYVLDGIEIKPRSRLELLIGGHWILGLVFATERGSLIWSSWAECVHVNLSYLMDARWPEAGR